MNAYDPIDALLAAAGSDKTRILMAQIFLPDLADFDGMNSVWDAWVTPGHTTPRATVQARLASPAAVAATFGPVALPPPVETTSWYSSAMMTAGCFFPRLLPFKRSRTDCS